MNARIVWNGMGGELDSVVVSYEDESDKTLTDALIRMLRGSIVTVGDSFLVEEIDERAAISDEIEAQS